MNVSIQRGHILSFAALTIFLVGFFALESFRPVLLVSNTGTWLYEADLVASGAAPYSDFTLQYPPIGSLIFGALTWVFGSSTFLAYGFVFVTGLLAAAIVYAITRVVGFGAVAAVTTTVAVIGASVIVRPNSLFSLSVGTPTIVLGSLGLLLFLLGAAVWLLQGRSWGSGVVGIGTGICIASKPEFAASVIVGSLFLSIGIMLSRDQQLPAFRRRWTALHWGIAFALPAFVYGIVLLRASPKEVVEGITGYAQSGFNGPDIGAMLSTTGAGLMGMVFLFIVSALVISSRLPILIKGGFGNVMRAASVAGVLLPLAVLDQIVSSGYPLMGGVAIALMLAVITWSWRFGIRRTRRELATQIGTILAGLGAYGGYVGLSGGTEWETVAFAPLRLGEWLSLAVVVAFCVRWFLLYRQRRRVDPLEIFVVVMSAAAAFLHARALIDPGGARKFLLFDSFFMIILGFMVLRKLSESHIVVRAKKVPFTKYAFTGATGALVFLALMLGFARPVSELRYATGRVVDTDRGPIVLAEDSVKTVRRVLDVVHLATSPDEHISAVTYSPWVNYATGQPTSLAQTQTQIFELSDEWKRRTLQKLNSTPPSLIVEEYINKKPQDDSAASGWGSNSRNDSPHIWTFIEEHFDPCYEFIDGAPRDGMWGAMFYTVKPDSELRLRDGFNPVTCEMLKTDTAAPSDLR